MFDGGAGMALGRRGEPVFPSRFPSPIVRSPMVFIADWGSVFDAPVDVVWTFLRSDIDHGNSHKGRRNLERQKVNDNTILLSWEHEVDGTWVRFANRLTFHEPIGFFVETVEGPMAGSKFFNYYVPKGDRTEVVVVGEWASPTIPPAQLEEAVWAILEKVYMEDSASLKEYSKSPGTHY